MSAAVLRRPDRTCETVARRQNARRRWHHHLSRPARPHKIMTPAGKRLLDLAVAGLLLALLWPLMALIAVAIRIDSPGSALFRQTRTGRNGAPFTILKFRTMRLTTARPGQAHVAASFQDRLGEIQVNGHHPGITRTGRLLRASSLDELPQLLNVLQGEMSLVGPRPHLSNLDELFRPLLPHIHRRHAVRPGMTGLAQVNGHRGPTPDVTAMAERLGDDLAYIGAMSLWLDLRILALTPLRLLETGESGATGKSGAHIPKRGLQTLTRKRSSALPMSPGARYIGCRRRGRRDLSGSGSSRVSIHAPFLAGRWPVIRRGGTD